MISCILPKKLVEWAKLVEWSKRIRRSAANIPAVQDLPPPPPSSWSMMSLRAWLPLKPPLFLITISRQSNIILSWTMSLDFQKKTIKFTDATSRQSFCCLCFSYTTEKLEACRNGTRFSSLLCSQRSATSLSNVIICPQFVLMAQHLFRIVYNIRFTRIFWLEFFWFGMFQGFESMLIWWWSGMARSLKFLLPNIQLLGGQSPSPEGWLTSVFFRRNKLIPWVLAPAPTPRLGKSDRRRIFWDESPKPKLTRNKVFQNRKKAWSDDFVISPLDSIY